MHSQESAGSLYGMTSGTVCRSFGGQGSELTSLLTVTKLRVGNGRADEANTGAFNSLLHGGLLKSVGQRHRTLHQASEWLGKHSMRSGLDGHKRQHRKRSAGEQDDVPRDRTLHGPLALLGWTAYSCMVSGSSTLTSYNATEVSMINGKY